MEIGCALLKFILYYGSTPPQAKTEILDYSHYEYALAIMPIYWYKGQRNERQ